MTDSILIVDSDESVLSILNKAIQSAGMESKTVSCGEEALELVRKQSFDLILLDVNLQGMVWTDFMSSAPCAQRDIKCRL